MRCSVFQPNPEKGRRQGRCPLTPEEVGLMLRALGYRKDVHIYVASGEIYGGARTLAPLKALFPNLHTKETISSKEELAPFSKYSSRMAALDFIVCDESDAFVANNNGNMAKILAGRRYPLLLCHQWFITCPDHISCPLQEILWAQENDPTKCQKALSLIFEQRKHVVGCILLKSTHGSERIYGRAQRAEAREGRVS